MLVPVSFEHLQSSSDRDVELLQRFQFNAATASSLKVFYHHTTNAMELMSSNARDLTVQLSRSEIRSALQDMLNNVFSTVEQELQAHVHKRVVLKNLSFTVTSIPWFLQRFADLKGLQVEVTASIFSSTEVTIQQIGGLQGYDVDNLIDDLARCLYRLNFLMKPCNIPVPYSDGSFPAVHVLCPTVEKGSCPTWDEALTNRFNAAESKVFMAAVGQVYDPLNRSRQLIYIYDPKGRSGKSRILETVFAPLKTCTCGLSKSSLNNQFRLCEGLGQAASHYRRQQEQHAFAFADHSFDDRR